VNAGENVTMRASFQPVGITLLDLTCRGEGLDTGNVTGSSTDQPCGLKTDTCSSVSNGAAHGAAHAVLKGCHLETRTCVALGHQHRQLAL
jgi:hypothetical protein